MFKHTLFGLVLFLALSSSFAHGGETFAAVGGDFNKDGIGDSLVVTKGADIQKIFAFYFGQANGKSSLFQKVKISLEDDTKISVTDKGVLRVQQGSSEEDVFLFRFQNGDFYLIGGKKDRHKNEHYDISYNFSTGKMIKTTGEGKLASSSTLSMPKLPPLRFGWFPLSYSRLETFLENGSVDDETKIADLIYQRMICEDILYGLHWRGDLQKKGKNIWVAEGVYESPANYNFYGFMELKKQKDGTYRIKIDGSRENRECEHELDTNEDACGDEYPTSSSSESWVFEKGNFIER